MTQNDVSLLLIEDNPGDARLVEEMLKESDSFKYRIERADTLLSGLDKLVHSRFDAALVDLSLPDCHGLETVLTIQLHAPELPIIVLTGMDDQELALAAVHKGAQDYLVKGTLDSQSLSRAVQYAIVRHSKGADPAKTDAARASTIGFLGVKGGVGTTTISCHYALELRRQTDESTLLVNLDASSPGAAFLLNLKPAYTALDAATNLHRLDGGFWRGIVCSGPDKLDLLAAPGATRFAEAPSAERVHHVLRFARGMYRWMVVDLGTVTPASINLLDAMERVLLVTTDEVPVMYQASRLLKKLTELNVAQGRLELMVNRSRAGSSSDLERAFGRPVSAVIGDYTAELRDAWAPGQMVKRRSKLNRQVGKAVARHLGRDEGQVRGRLAGLLRSWRPAAERA